MAVFDPSFSFGYRHNLAFFRLSRKVLLRFREGSALLFVTNNGVTPKHTVSSMAGDLHRNHLRHIGLNHVAGCRAAKIME
jgi:hypothetical protein